MPFSIRDKCVCRSFILYTTYNPGTPKKQLELEKNKNKNQAETSAQPLPPPQKQTEIKPPNITSNILIEQAINKQKIINYGNQNRDALTHPAIVNDISQELTLIKFNSKIDHNFKNKIGCIRAVGIPREATGYVRFNFSHTKNMKCQLYAQQFSLLAHGKKKTN
ncbi:unnamed protein product [Cunninghamella blakesleeana]